MTLAAAPATACERASTCRPPAAAACWSAAPLRPASLAASTCPKFSGLAGLPSCSCCRPACTACKGVMTAWVSYACKHGVEHAGTCSKPRYKAHNWADMQAHPVPRKGYGQRREPCSMRGNGGRVHARGNSGMR